MTSIMLDLETMGTNPNAPIISIGAVAFDLDALSWGDTFYRRVSLDSAVRQGAVIDPPTVMWWLQQSDEARAEFNHPGLAIAAALIEFSEWAKSVAPSNILQVWGNGATFDNVILTTAYQRAGMCRPWSYKGDRCYRTVAAMYPQVDKQPYGTKHNAVHDAIAQAQHLIDIWRTKDDHE